jgi:hypothetical protein
MAATFNLTGDNRIFCGADYGLGLTLKDGSGTAINLTGATLASQIRKTQASDTVLASFTATITDAAAGKVALSIPAATTATLPPTPDSSYWKYDILYTKSGTMIRILEGDVEVDAAVTRS